MSNRMIVRAVLSLLVMLGGISLFAQSVIMVIDNGGFYQKKQRPAVAFPHDMHMAALSECSLCHHRYEAGKNVLDESTLLEGNRDIRCRACHGVRKKGSVPAIEDAYHGQCMGCHRKNIRKNIKTGPVFCGSCHRRAGRP